MRNDIPLIILIPLIFHHPVFASFILFLIRFDSMELLVADGLISMYMDKHAADYIQRMADEAIYEQRSQRVSIIHNQICRFHFTTCTNV